MRFPNSLTFRKAIDPDTRIEAFLGACVLNSFLRRAVTDDEDLEILHGLRTHALKREGQVDRRPNEWQQNGESGIHVRRDCTLIDRTPRPIRAYCSRLGLTAPAPTPACAFAPPVR